jgi:peptidyl-prolyl cis-trans isomerase C
MFKEDSMQNHTISTAIPLARINGVALHTPGETLPEEDLRQRACTELLRQAALSEGLLCSDDATPSDGAISEEATAAIEALLERNLNLPEPSQETCRRYYDTHLSLYRSGEKAHVRHILFAVTPGVNVVSLRQRAEAALLDVRCHDGKANDGFAKAAKELSNCPSGAQDGDLGWLTPEDCAPEFARELFGRTEVGVLPRLVHSRFGLHVVEVLARESGMIQSFEAVQGAIAMTLHQQTYVTAIRQYLMVLTGKARVEGVDLDSAATPLVQ